MRINIKLFSVSLIFAALSGIISSFFQYFYVYWMNLLNSQYLGELWIVLQITAFLINPIAILFVFYYIGKKYDLSKLLGEAIISVFSGLIIGFYLTNITVSNLSVYFFSLTITDNILLSYLISMVYAIENSLGMFFVVFAGLAIGCFRSTQGKVEIPSSDKEVMAESSPKQYKFMTQNGLFSQPSAT